MLWENGARDSLAAPPAYDHDRGDPISPERHARPKADPAPLVPNSLKIRVSRFAAARA